MAFAPQAPLQWEARLLLGVPETAAATAAAVAESGPLEAPQQVRQDSQGD